MTENNTINTIHDPHKRKKNWIPLVISICLTIFIAPMLGGIAIISFIGIGVSYSVQGTDGIARWLIQFLNDYFILAMILGFVLLIGITFGFIYFISWGIVRLVSKKSNE